MMVPSSHWAFVMTTATHGSEQQLIAAAQAGNLHALEALLRRHHERLWRVAQRLSGPDVSAEDILQDTLLQILRTLHQFRGEARFSTWASAIARSQASRQRRRNLREQHRRQAVSFVEGGVPGYLSESLSNPERETADGRLRTRMSAALERLGPLDREVFLLSQVHELTAPEVARCLELSVPAVKSRLHRARRELRELLSEVPPSGPRRGGFEAGIRASA